MNHSLSGYLARLIALSLVLSILGCTSPSQPSRFYRLDSQLSGAVMPERPVTGEELPLVGVGPIRLASYLDRPQLIERISSHQLNLYEFDRWAGTLQENMVQVLSNVMQQALPQAQVIGHPWHSSVQPDYEVILYISRFDRQLDKIKLQARWSLVEQRKGRLLRLDQTVIETSTNGGGIEAGVKASSDAVQILAKEIAAQLQTLIADQL
ncbi:MAG: PqiC family protein [Candidatus Thiodiazotropha sp. (ex Monitilora ramsayi)]|nr:PqiC family protein [Candidatus Thiodiazotropha sp. (ex Monitilora ramsayi)]